MPKFSAHLRWGALREDICGIILQAPVSDREAMQLGASAEEDVVRLNRALDHANELVQSGNGDRLMARDTPQSFRTPITASRFSSLGGRCTPDDMFSSDLTDEDLKRILGHVSQRKHCRVLAVFSGADEYVPPLVLENYKEFAIRLCSAMGTQ